MTSRSCYEILFSIMVGCCVFPGLVAAQSLYWTDQSPIKIQAGSLDGSGSPTDLFVGAVDGIVVPIGIALDVAGGTVYWSDLSQKKIQSGNLDGSGSPTDLFDNPTDGLGAPTGIALDVANNMVYWVDYSNAKIQVGNLDGSGSPTDLFDVTDGVSTPYGIALDVANNKVYWTEQGNKRIRMGNLNGSGSPTDLFDSGDGLDLPSEIALDISGAMIYWADGYSGAGSSGRKIQAGNLDGSGLPTTLFDDATDGLVFPTGIALDLTNSEVYWTDLASGKIQRGALDGSGSPTDLFDNTDGVMAPTGLAVDLAAGPPADVISMGIDGTLGQAYDDGYGDWTITFDASVSNMDVGDVTLTHSGTSAATGLVLQSFSKATGTSFTFRATGVTGIGSMTLTFTPVDVTTTSNGTAVTESMTIGSYLSTAALAVSSLWTLVLLIGTAVFGAGAYISRRVISGAPRYF